MWSASSRAWGTDAAPTAPFSEPSDERRFELIVRVVEDGTVSQYLASLHPGDDVALRGRKGQSMIRPADRSAPSNLFRGAEFLSHYRR